MKTAGDMVKEKDRPPITVPESATLREAVAAMTEQHVGSILVTRDGEIVGIWTERDLLEDVGKKGFTLSSPVGEHMSTGLHSVSVTDSVYTLVDTILGLRVRHLLVRKGDDYVGLLSAGDVMRATIRQKNRELAEKNAPLGWRYYDEWAPPEDR
jgi:signal-transduction protein with cAMP-binding, CBS, and nucleotidyltransferase domain